ncbi:hypothetical protein FG386_000332 [Cryptosporidium ryanae]|uniref:uncharacterized protein n=1 Tax=Cryptosporidium ryanae TaxID=515981 RepID=UPI00351A65C1|nr:hypothetical protein FG386_000332 [Cryptosporidium ryanae]
MKIIIGNNNGSNRVNECFSMEFIKNILTFFVFLLLINILFSDLHVTCNENEDVKEILVNTQDEEIENKTQNSNSSVETIILVNSRDLPLNNILELDIQDQCNQLWSLRKKIIQELSRLVKNHKEFVLFLSKEGSDNDTFYYDEIFRSSLKISSKNNISIDISEKIDKYLDLASEHMLISIEKETEKAKINICEGSFHSSLREFFQIRKEYKKFLTNIDLCTRKRKKTVKNGLSGINTLLYLARSINASSNSATQKDDEYLKNTLKKYQPNSSSSKFAITLNKFQDICDVGIVEENEVSRIKKLRWLKKNMHSIIKSLNAFETLIKRIALKNTKNFVNCISHFQGLNSINKTTGGFVDAIGNLILSHYNNRKNILNIIMFRYSSTVLNKYILNNKIFSLWLLIQNRVTSIQALFSIVNGSNELTARVNSHISMENLAEIISKCSEILRKTASNWDIFYSATNESIMNKMKKEVLDAMNKYSLGFQNRDLINLDWDWLSLNIETVIKKLEGLFKKLLRDNIEEPLSVCSKNLSPTYKLLVAEFKPNKIINDKDENKIMNKYGNKLNEVLNNIMRQQQSISSFKNMFLWPRNNATVYSAISMYNRTAELIKSLNTTVQYQVNSSFNSSVPSSTLLRHQLVISEEFSNLYNNIKMRSDWDLKIFHNDFGYMKKVSCDVENENTIERPILKINYDHPLKPGKWFSTSLEFYNVLNDKFEKVNKIIDSSVTFRLQFVEQWSDIVSKLITNIGNPIAFIVNKHSEEAFSYYLEEQINVSREFSSIIEGNISILKFIDEFDKSLTDLNMDSFVSKFETQNEPKEDESYRSDDEFSSVSGINDYLLDLRKRIENFCIENLQNENKESIRTICESLSFVYTIIEKNMREVTLVLQKLFADLDAQKIELVKLDSIIQSCVSLDKKIDRVKCWAPNQFLELPIRRTLQIRRVMTETLREIIRTKILDLSNYIETYININFDNSLVFENKSVRSVAQETTVNCQDNKELVEGFSVLLKLTSEIMSHIMDELNSLESVYINYYKNQIQELKNSSKKLIYNFVKLNSMKVTLIHNYGKPNIFQKIFRFPKLILSKNEVADIENLTSEYKTVVNNNVTFANDLCDYIKKNMVLANNHTFIFNKFLRTLSTTKRKLEGITSLLLENPNDLESASLKAEIELNKYSVIQQKAFFILSESDKFLKLGNVENFRYLTIRNMTSNVSDTIMNLSDEINSKELELEKKEESIANTNCFRRWRWKRRVKKRNKKKISKKGADKVIKTHEKKDNSRKLQEIKKEANKKLNQFLLKTVVFDDLGVQHDSNKIGEPISEDKNDDYSDRSDIGDLESFQFDDYYKFDNRPGYYNPKNHVNDYVSYDLDTGGHTDIGKKINNVLVKVGSAVELAFKVNDFVQQYKEIKKSLKEGADLRPEESGVNLMTFFNVLNAISGGPGDDIEAMFGPNQDENVFDDASIFGQLHLVDDSGNKEFESDKTRKRLESIDISYEDFKQKINLELKGEDFDFDD